MIDLKQITCNLNKNIEQYKVIIILFIQGGIKQCIINIQNN